MDKIIQLVGGFILAAFSAGLFILAVMAAIGKLIWNSIFNDTEIDEN